MMTEPQSAVTVSRGLSRCVTFIDLVNGAITGRFQSATLVHMCTHLFDNDLDFETMTGLINQLIQDINDINNRFDVTLKSMIVGPSFLKTFNDQRMQTLIDACNAVFAYKSDDEQTNTRQVALYSDEGELLDFLPVFVYGDVQVFTVQYPADDYTPEERGIILTDVSGALHEAHADALKKIKYMREGEDY